MGSERKRGMIRKRQSNRNLLEYQKLEDKVYLTVVASVTPTGSLSVTGFADGTVQITAQGNQRFLITDNGAQVANVSGVRQNIAVKMNTSPLNDTVRIDLANEVIANVVVELSDGNNDFQITGNSPILRVVYRGGSGSDTVVTNIETQRITAVFGFDGSNQFDAQNNSRRFRYRGGADADQVTLGFQQAPGAIQVEYVGVVMGDGDNRFESYANVLANQYVRGGSDADVMASYNVGGTAIFQMGDGNNVLFLDGSYDRTFIRGGFGSDSIFFDSNSSVSSRLGIILLGGNDFVRVDGRVNTDFFFNSTDGDDQVFINSSARIAGDVSVLLGADSNIFTHNGEILGDLYVASFNASDNYRIGGSVVGTIRLRPGGQGGGG